MRKILLGVLLITLHQNITGQKLTLPVAYQEITYQNTIQLSTPEAPSIICNHLQHWMLRYVQENNAQIISFQENNCSLEVTLKQILEPSGTFKDVYSIYTISFYAEQGKLQYNISNLLFSKNNIQYKVYDVYRHYLQGNPYVKLTAETKIAALRRHEYLMSLLHNNIEQFIQLCNNNIN